MSGPTGYRKIAEGRYRETVGLSYDEMTEGLVIEHRPGRTITDADNVLMTTLGGNDAPLHTDHHYSRHTAWGRPLVCSSIILHIVGGMTVRSTSGLTIANLGFDQIRCAHPVFVGDTLYAETEILERRRSRSRPTAGLVTCRTTGHNQDHLAVMTFTRTFLVPLDTDAVRDRTHY
ncbi:MaoC family dehydratase [Streptomyces sp. ME03-5684b]|uniref:MaoC family dehydratase n=1 Tax=Streptomyces sp. ME03-5684b TaxID=3028681 RepID=UPI0029A893C6|nr:MaoC family dehydratase [Streptomyces sp. ME03-5684b]MDX3321183.1 MaoC family dehydratase [Streptomyces sp. ME03-5684b]